MPEPTVERLQEILAELDAEDDEQTSVSLTHESGWRLRAYPDGLLVWGTGSGSRRDPDWFRNLRAAQSTDVQIGALHTSMHARELTGPELDTVWTDVILREDPRISRFAAKARRTIPVAVLNPA